MRTLAVGLALLATAALADFCPPDSPQSAGMRDIMLAYLGKDCWHQADFRPYVAFLDKAHGGQPRDWFYDAWLFLMYGGAPSGGSYMEGLANAADWRYYLDLLFAPDQNLAALDACLAEVGEKLGDRGRVAPVIIMIPYLSREAKGFGDLDCDGTPENPAQDAGRVRAMSALVDQVVTRFAAGQYPHLKLWGFYWMNEGIGPGDEAAVRAVADYVHGKGYGLHWIPYFQAAGSHKWRELGFDFAVIQPNYAFMNRLPGAVVNDEQRLTLNALDASAVGLGVEMEMDGGIEADPGKRLNLQLYLNHGVDALDGTMRRAVRAYYQGTDSIAKLYASPLPECNRLYEDLYRFHRGTYQRRPVSLCEGARCLVNGVAAPRLTDGLWPTQPGQDDRLTWATVPATVELDLGAGQSLGEVRVQVIVPADQAAGPQALRVSTAGPGGQWAPAGEFACPPLPALGAARGGFVIGTFAPRFATRLRLELTGQAGSRLGLGEVVSFPAQHLLWGAPAQVTGTPAGLSAAAGVLLNDGRLAAGAGQPGAVGFAANGTATLDLGDNWRLGRALAHVHWTAAKAPRYRFTALVEGKPTWQGAWQSAAGRGSAWIETALPGVAADCVRFELSGGAGVGWDELQVQPAANLAAGKPYRVNPPFPAHYGDAEGRELTDGQLTEKGFSDGRTVGWCGRPVTVTLDLGQPRELDAVRVFAEGGGYAAVHYPPLLEVWGSANGNDWQLLASGPPTVATTHQETVGLERLDLGWLRQSFAPVTMRHLRLRAVSRGWLMLSEVEAQHQGQNLAGGCAYHLAPQPDSSAPYADDGLRLTDGDLSRAGEGWGRAVGWNTGTPEVTVDLLAPTQVALVRAHVLGGGPGAVYFPGAMQVATSLDGTTWSDETAVTCQRPETGKDGQVTFLDTALPPREARYVRLRFAPQNWCMVDEVQVFGGEQRETGRGKREP